MEGKVMEEESDGGGSDGGGGVMEVGVMKGGD